MPFFSLRNLLRLATSLLTSLSIAACTVSSNDVSTPIISNHKKLAISTQNPSIVTAQSVALLLPLQGPFANIGHSVKQGFLAAAEQSKPSPHIILIDTSVKSIPVAYTEALARKAQIIVGPLLKPQVQSIASLQTSIPILALNYLNSDITTPPELYQFGLSPIDETQKVTQLAWQRGKRSALIITANGSWGSQMGEAFAQQWQALGGTINGQLTLSQNHSLITKQISHFLHFRPPHDRRIDFDVIFLASSPQIGRQVKPLLKFFYAGDIPVYATASIYSGIPRSQRLDKDLNQIIFCAAPWSIARNTIEPILYRQLQSASPLHFSQNSKYYALGIDAFHILQQLAYLGQSPQQTFQGATGLLSLNSQHRIVRQLPCVQFRNGYLVRID